MNSDGYPGGCGTKIGEYDDGPGTERLPVTCGLRIGGGVALCGECIESGPALFLGPNRPPFGAPWTIPYPGP